MLIHSHKHKSSPQRPGQAGKTSPERQSQPAQVKRILRSDQHQSENGNGAIYKSFKTLADNHEHVEDRTSDLPRQNRPYQNDIYTGPSASNLMVQMDEKPGDVGPSSTGKEIAVGPDEEDEESIVQTSRSSFGARQEAALSGYIDRSSDSGSPIDSKTEDRMSKAFGYDFSKVKIHNNASANRVSRSLGANAFTTGNDIYFDRGKYKPGALEGDRLLSHELTHVVQQSGGLIRKDNIRGLTMGASKDAHEQQAHTVSEVVTNALHGASSGDLMENESSQVEASIVQASLAEAILQRKAGNVPELQRDAGLTVSIIGVLVSAGTWAAGQSGSNPMTVDPRLERIAEANEDREQYRSAHPFRHQSWSFFSRIWEGATAISLDRHWMVDLRWQYNGAELTDVHLVQGWKDFSPWDSTHAKLVMIDNQASNKKIGFRCEFEWDPAMPGHGLFQCEGWISADGSAQRTDWSWHDY